MDNVIDLEAKRRERMERKEPVVVYSYVSVLDRSAEEIAELIRKAGPMFTQPRDPK